MRVSLGSTQEAQLRLAAPGFRIGAAFDVAFSRSGRLLGQVGRRVCAYDVAARRLLMRSQWHYPHPAALTFGISDEWMAVRSTTGAIAVVDLQTGQPHARLPPSTEIADDSPLMTAPTGEHVIEACSSGQLRVRSVKDLRIEYAEQHGDYMLGPIATTADHSQWAVAFNRKQLDAPRQPPCRIEVRAWPLGAANRRVLGDEFGYVQALAFGPGGDRIAVLERDAQRGELVIAIVSTITGAVEGRATSPGWGGHRGFAWSSDGSWLVVGTDQGHALLDAHALTSVGHLGGEYSSDAAFSPDGQLLALGYWGNGFVLPVTDLRLWFQDRSSK